ncbi:MAG TPA: ABC transporter substrate-binding protein [Beijerinckiaceae bacterium]|jgi:NitT/TauT family transport system substrate-binding protein
MLHRKALAVVAAVAALLHGAAASAQDKLKVAIGQRGTLENSITELGQDAGFFKKHGLVLEILYTQGGGETQQAVISGSVDIGIGVGTHGVFGAFAKGAPLRIIGAGMTGANDLFWYVPANSPLKSIKETAGKTVAYSTTGSSSNSIVLAFQKHFGVALKPVATGSPPATFTQVMSGQIDVGWATPSFGVQQGDKIRAIARGGDVPDFRDQTVRVTIANAGALEQRRDAFVRYMRAYRETLDWLYSNPAAIKPAAAWTGMPESQVARVRDEFYPKESVNPDRMSGVEKITADAIAFKFLPAPLSKEQLAQLVQVPFGVK